jgi:hypothetical protein
MALVTVYLGLLLLTLTPKPALPATEVRVEPTEDPWAAYEQWVAARDAFLNDN